MTVTPVNANLAYADALKRAAGAKTDGVQVGASGAAAGPDFADLVRDVVEAGLDSAKSAESTAMLAAAKQAEIVDIVTAVANAELTLSTVVAVRDKVVQAYQDILRMPI